ncbi:DUF6906 family protein [Ectobacillus ponti]|uniref:DUF6906 domain-containing protein n=1 Tax=Ectobacillus ponti TaxID=2961894 RepID=A0AA41X679_9BACI|nr:hypothetical protein [Ectobacillus ponti]MCP8969696.1 hypothetical protein [Ectobacillus ponti]
MKNGKKPTRRQSGHIQSYGLSPENWLIFKIVDGDMHLVHRFTGQTRVIPTL